MTGPRTITLAGAGGGSGTSTIAAALALFSAGQHATELVAHDPEEMTSLLGVTKAADPHAVTTVVPGLDLVSGSASGNAEVVVFDAGSRLEEPETAAEGECYVVVRGPCYLALRRLVRAEPGRWDGVILLTEPGRSLGATDVAEVLGVPVVAQVAQHPTVARAIDAGLLQARVNRLQPLHALCSLALAPPRRCAPQRLSPRSRVHSTNPTPTHDIPERTPEESGTDWPCPLFSGHGGRGLGRDTRIGVARGRIGRPTGGHHRVEHRQVATRCRRLLRRGGREITGGVLPRPR